MSFIAKVTVIETDSIYGVSVRAESPGKADVTWRCSKEQAPQIADYVDVTITPRNEK